MFFVFKQKTAYEMRISDWSSDVCSSDLIRPSFRPTTTGSTSRSTAPADGSSIIWGITKWIGESVTDRKNIAVIGAGYWGPNLARNFRSSADWNQIGRASCRERVCQYV